MSTTKKYNITPRELAEEMSTVLSQLNQLQRDFVENGSQTIPPQVAIYAAAYAFWKSAAINLAAISADFAFTSAWIETTMMQLTILADGPNPVLPKNEQTLELN